MTGVITLPLLLILTYYLQEKFLIIAVLLNFVFFFLLAWGVFSRLYRKYIGSGLDYIDKRSVVVNWIVESRNSEFQMRLKDIIDYKNKENDSSCAKRFRKKPEINFDPNTAFSIVSDLVSAGLLKVHISATKVEEFTADFTRSEKEWKRFQIYHKDELILGPLKIIRDKISWFFVTLFSSLTSLYAREILSTLELAP